MKTEIAYLGHDNSIDLVLKADGAAVDLTSVTRMTLSLGSVLIDSDNGSTDPIRWTKSDYVTGEVRLFLGGISAPPNTYDAWLVVYDPSNVDGIVWGSIKIMIVAEVEVAAP